MPAERGEVVQADQPVRGRVGGCRVERLAEPRHQVPLQGVDGRPHHPVAVAPPDGGKAGVEVRVRDAHPVHHQVGRQRAVETPPKDGGKRGRIIGLEVDVGDLPGRVDAGVRPARNGQLDRGREAEDPPDPGLELALDRPQSGLGRPPVEVRAVVGQVETEPGHVASVLR